MKSFVLGLAGGSGVGKSTLAFGLQDEFGEDNVLIFHIDDYFKPKELVPIVDGVSNFDHPDALYVDKIAKDLKMLIAGRPVTIMTKSPRHNPDFLKTKQRIPVEFPSKPLIVVEGFLTLRLKPIRELLDSSIYLDAPFDRHIVRRVHGKIHNFPMDYTEKILRPMHQKYVEPSKQYADEIIDVSELTAEQVLDRVSEMIKPHLTTD